MRRRRTPLMPSAFADSVVMGLSMALFVALGVAVIVFAAVGAVFFFQQMSSQTHYAIEQTLYSTAGHPVSPEERAYRKAAAQSLVKLHEKTFMGKPNTPLDGATLEQLRHAARTGDRIDIPDSRWDIDPSVLLSPWFFLGLWGAIGIGGVREYRRKCCQRHRLADLPWKKTSLRVMVVIAGPTMWFSLLVSAIFMRGDPVLNISGATLPGDLGMEVLEGYLRFRQGDTQHARERLREEAQTALEQAKADAGELAGQVRERQRSIADLTLRCRELEGPPHEDQSEVDVIEELRQMTELPGVLKIEKIDEAIRFTIRTSYVQEGTTFDLGDWVIDFEPGMTRLVAICLRSGVKPGWQFSDPPYRHPNGDFCFGNQQPVIDEHLKRQQYLQALSLAITSLNSVNPEDEGRIDEVFETADIVYLTLDRMRAIDY